MSDRIELRMGRELLERLDAARGDVPRGTFIKRALESALGGRAIEDASVGHAQVGTDRGGSLPPSSPVPSRAPEEPVAEVLGAKVWKGASAPAFKCPVARCDFRAKSPAAKCGLHGRTVVPVE